MIDEEFFISSVTFLFSQLFFNVKY